MQLQALNLFNIPVGTPPNDTLNIYSDDTDWSSTSSDDDFDIQPVHASLPHLAQNESLSDEEETSSSDEEQTSSSDEEETSSSDDELTAPTPVEQAHRPIQDTSSSSDWDSSEDEELTEEYSSSYSDQQQPAHGASCVGEPAGRNARVSATAVCMLCTFISAIYSIKFRFVSSCL